LFGWLIWKKKLLILLTGYDESTSFKGNKNQLAKHKEPSLIGGLSEKRVFNKEISRFSNNVDVNMRKGEHCIQLVC
jgi:hypothetical protein